MSDNTLIDYEDDHCTICHNKMLMKLANHYYCQTCKKNYQQHAICPICEQQLEQITGYGSISYLCRIDGLISRNKLRYHLISE